MGIFAVDRGGSTAAMFFAGGANSARKLCNFCNTAPANLFCVSDSALLCVSCDSKVHNDDDDDALLLHQRVWICEVCEQAPAVVTCKADAAALCAACDGEIHSANSLASRHERVSIVPAGKMGMKSGVGDDGVGVFDFHSPPPTELVLLDSDPPGNFLDFDYYQTQPFIDSVVPVQTPPPVPPTVADFHEDYSTEKNFKLEFTNTHPPLIPQQLQKPDKKIQFQVSSPSVDFGVVPDGESISEISNPYSRSISISIDAASKNQASQSYPNFDREARVLRYKEKKKRRKFEKTIRYASRKANAELKPRIKGRFVKRTLADEADGRGIYAGAERYGVVPSFCN